MAQGYQRKGSIHIRSINPDFCSYVDTGELRKGVATIKPWVGLHHHGVQRLPAELHDREPQDEEFSATIAANVGYVLDGVYRDWIDPTSPDGAVLLKAGRPKVQNAAQAAAVAGIGRPGTPSEVMSAIEQACKVLDGYADLRKLPEARRIRGSLVQPHFTLVAIYLLLGDEVSACRWLVEGERMDCQQEGPVCEQFRRFERNALARMSADAPAELERQRVEASKPAQTAPAVVVIGRLFGRKPKAR